MATITTVTTAVPPYVLTCADVKEAAQQYLPLDARRMAAIMAIFDNAEVERRYSVFPLEYLAQQRTLSQTSQEYQEHAIALTRQASISCLTRAGLHPSEIDMLITVSATGVMIPAVDAYLINELDFRPNVRRLPINELGCVAGAVALSRARDFVKAFPDSNVLVVAVELPTLTFQHKDLSQANLISLTLFGDGAAAALVTGKDGSGVGILDSESYFFRDTLSYMGFDLRDNGFHIVLSKDIPTLIRGNFKQLLVPFLVRNGLTYDQLAAYVLHPGGKRILLYLEEEFGLDRSKLEPSWEVLRNYGNTSSTSVFFVLDKWIQQQQLAPGSYGLMAAFGPGFSAEMLLLRWQ